MDDMVIGILGHDMTEGRRGRFLSSTEEIRRLKLKEKIKETLLISFDILTYYTLFLFIHFIQQNYK